MFRQWMGEPVDTYGGKALVDAGGSPLFAELAVLDLLKKDGWDGVWFDGYRGKFRTGMPSSSDPVQLPAKQAQIWRRIVEANGGRSGGSWDIFAWREEDLRFVECKRRRKDRIKENQRNWFAAARSAGIPLDSFLIAEWDLDE